ncbi:MAG TPA: triose-phosphate isomerase [Verrucomicrobia bacterium]|nr:triose-phosphate isomerase [Verrucomicrobiota bacterium]
MKQRKRIIAGNWKMNKTASESQALAEDVKRELGECRDVEVVLCPPFTSLQTVADVVGETAIKFGAQNMHWEASGAYTGEISAFMLRSLYCHFVILGHSERRSYFGETDAIINKKTKSAIAASLTPIVCVGETIAERQANSHMDVVRTQVQGSLADISPAELKKIVVAYEPVWAIGTGLTATPEQAQEMHAFIRSVLTDMSNEEVAQSIRIQYGGSMKPSNAAELLAKPDIDGGLIGGASLDARSFVELVRIAQQR